MKKLSKRAIKGVSSLLLVCVLVSCSKDENGPGAPQPEVPKLSEVMAFTGGATGLSEDITVQCICDLRLEITQVTYNENGSQVHVGNLGGEITRVILDEEGNGFSFAPFLFGEVIVTVGADNSVTLSWPGNLDTGIRFYDEIAIFEGDLQEDGTVTGTWNCAPLDLDEGGYVDLKGTVAGSWGLTPSE